MNNLRKKVFLPAIVVVIAMQLMIEVHGVQENLLDNYLPATMQALAYYIDLLQYEPVYMTTIEPPFFVDDVDERTTTAKPTTTTKTTSKKPTSSWFQSPSWWSSTQATETSTTVKPFPTQKHKPGLYAPFSADMLYIHKNSTNTTNTINKPDEPTAKLPFDSDAEFIKWWRSQKRRQDSIDEEELTNNALDFLPLSLKRDIYNELDNQDQHTEIENLNYFLQKYDDKYGNYKPREPITGKKRIPPTKTYVDFLLTYDLLKRDAKAANLSKYEGYTEKIIEDLYELSKGSPQRQLYTLFKKMLDRKEIQRTDIVTRAKKMVKELGDGKSAHSKSLMYFPALQFIP